ncbi:MAG: tryptophan synthase subunit alpha, partial [Candidatus Margulisbacteria bacterium]|nr:tryptophan synthase subunit alpha [Candidatus Margulisiibacteriota bacterium]
YFKNNKLLIPYFTYGDPNTDFTENLVLKSVEEGADIIELGIPFSDPVADGPVIQASHHRALSRSQNVTVLSAFQMIKRLKKTISTPIIVMLSVNLVLHHSVKPFFNLAKEYGVDGVVIPDLSFEDSKDYLRASKLSKVPLIYLISPVCSDERIHQIVKASSGFVYLISSLGTTGERKTISSKLKNSVSKIKAIKDIPVVVGFGISKKEHLKQIYKYADGVIIGSYFVKKIHTYLTKPGKALLSISKSIREFKSDTGKTS